MRKKQVKVVQRLITLVVCFMFVGVACGQDEANSFLESLQRHTWEIGPEVSYIKYKEPGVMETKGLMHGVAGSYTYRGWIPISAEESKPLYKRMLKAEGRFSYGEVDYDGALLNGMPYAINSIDDYVLEFRGLVGYDFPQEVSNRNSIEGLGTIYTGIGYRYLNDDSSFDPAGYERESNYLYAPIGVESIFALDNSWSFAVTVEYDAFLWGKQKSHLGGVFGTIKNRQKQGHGVRGSIEFQRKGKKVDFVIKPFIRYWYVDESEVDYAGGLAWVEPENHSTEYGLMLMWRF